MRCALVVPRLARLLTATAAPLPAIPSQIALRNYDPQKDKRFTGSFRLPLPPRPSLTVCVLGNESHCTQARALKVEAMVSGDGAAGKTLVAESAGCGGLARCERGSVVASASRGALPGAGLPTMRRSLLASINNGGDCGLHLLRRALLLPCLAVGSIRLAFAVLADFVEARVLS